MNQTTTQKNAAREAGQKARSLKVEKANVPRRGALATVPKIRLEGDWLRAAGFPENSRVTVEVSDGTLTIRADSGLE